MEVIKLENMGYYRDDMSIPGDVFLLQVSTYFTVLFSSPYFFPCTTSLQSQIESKKKTLLKFIFVTSKINSLMLVYFSLICYQISHGFHSSRVIRSHVRNGDLHSCRTILD